MLLPLALLAAASFVDATSLARISFQQSSLTVYWISKDQSSKLVL